MQGTTARARRPYHLTVVLSLALACGADNGSDEVTDGGVDAGGSGTEASSGAGPSSATTGPDGGGTDPTGADSTTSAGSTAPGDDSSGDSGGVVDPGDPLFFDDYDYLVTPTADDATANRQALWAAGYSRIKADNVDDAGEGDQSSQNGGAGTLYTVDVSEIPGHRGSAPGSTSRALCIHSRAGELQTQTDFYFQIGSGLGDIPADVYFQFWAYVAHSGEQLTEFHSREKFIYPTRNTYPATVGNNGGHWIFELSSSSSEPSNVPAGAPGEVFALSRDGTIESSPPFWDDPEAANQGTTGHLGQTDASAPLWTPNAWVETRIHYDTSGEQGQYEVWTRTVGEPWTPRVAWIGGTDVGGSPFSWPIDPAFRDGHAAIRIPTTLPGPGSTTPQYDTWIYLQDFAMADSADALPTYDGN